MEQQKQAEDQAAKVLQENEIYTFPVDLKKILNKEKIKLFTKLYQPEFSGKIQRNAKKTVIRVNGLHAMGKRRFTAAHQLGHYYFDIPESGGDCIDYRFRYKNELNFVEDRANHFAAALLIPQRPLNAAIKILNINSDCINVDTDLIKLSKAFVVCEAAIRFRLIRLNYNFQ